MTTPATTPLRLLCIFAHPDDESMGVGSTLARYAAEGVETYLVTATRGERGWTGDERDYPGPEALGRLREGELRAAAEVLGIREVSFLDYIDGDLDQADPTEAIGRIITHLRRIRPQVVVTFGPDGAYGHPDHIAICQFTGAAIVCAADSGYRDEQDWAPHRVAKLYYYVDTSADIAAYVPIIGDIVMTVDGVERRPIGWDEWAVTAKIDAGDYWRTAQEAVRRHKSQIVGLPDLTTLPEEQQRALWVTRSYIRAFSLVNGGRRVEGDLFEGIR